MTATRELVVLLEDREVARIQRGRGGKCTLTYDESWRYARGAYPLSLSMPLAAAQHPPRVVEPYLWGLLPDNELILERWARRFQVSARNGFGLLANVGDDCSGAVRLLPPDRIDALQRDGIHWLDEGDIAQRLDDLGSDESAWRRTTDEGQFSLAGAQPKIALWWDGVRWGLPSGRTPTTHILKPGISGRDGQALNEHFCMALARQTGLAVASSEIASFEHHIVIVVQRYDRTRHDEHVRRVHQEDMCQALAVHPANKYESDGGPGARAIVSLLRDNSLRMVEDVAAFVDALAFNWLIAGTDAHAKNYSLLIGAGGAVRLAPLYDVASFLPYRDFNRHKTKLAMKVGGKYRLRDIERGAWQKFAAEVRIDEDELLTRIAAMASSLPDHASDVAKQCRDAGLSHPIVPRTATAIQQRALECLRGFA